MPATTRAIVARVAGAVLLATGALIALRQGGAAWLVAAPCTAAALCFALWRTVAGAASGFGLLLVAAFMAWSPRDAASLQPLLIPLVLLECFGLATVAAVALARDPRRVSRRLLGCWLASGGMIAVGLSLAASLPARGTGSALVAAGLAWRLGTVPVYAWAPLLMRHPATRIVLLGVAATMAAGATLLFALGRLPHQSAAATTVAVLSGVTVPWALWHALRQWSRDRRCSITYAVVLAASQLLLLVVSRSRA